MPGLDPGIQGQVPQSLLLWIAGSSPAMTRRVVVDAPPATILTHQKHTGIHDFLMQPGRCDISALPENTHKNTAAYQPRRFSPIPAYGSISPFRTKIESRVQKK